MFDCEILIPKNVQELTTFLVDPSAKILAGGTDLIPRLQRGSTGALTELIDINRLSELRFIRKDSGWLEIGGLTTHAELISSPLIFQSAPILLQACSTIGAPQTRARGTLAGNLANASPAADTAGPLLVLEGQLELHSVDGLRLHPLKDFFCSPGKTQLRPGEFIYCTRFPLPTGRWGSSFLKLGRRKGMAVAVASAAVFLTLNGEGRIQNARVALGSVASTPVRSPAVEAVLLGAEPSPELFEKASAAVQADISPIDDIRASSDYRRRSVQVLLLRALQVAYEQASRRSA